MTNLKEEREAIVESLYAEHLEALMQEADMAVRCDVKDKEAYYERLRTGSRGLLDAVRQALLSHEEKVVAMVREEIRKLVKVKDPTRMHNPELGKINGYNKALTDVMNTLPITDEV